MLTIFLQKLGRLRSLAYSHTFSNLLFIIIHKNDDRRWKTWYNSTGLYSRGTQFESRPSYWLFWDFSYIFPVAPDEHRNSYFTQVTSAHLQFLIYPAVLKFTQHIPWYITSLFEKMFLNNLTISVSCIIFVTKAALKTFSATKERNFIVIKIFSPTGFYLESKDTFLRSFDTWSHWSASLKKRKCE